MSSTKSKSLESARPAQPPKRPQPSSPQRPPQPAVKPAAAPPPVAKPVAAPPAAKAVSKPAAASEITPRVGEIVSEPVIPTASNTTLEYYDGFDDYASADVIYWWYCINSQPDYRLSSVLEGSIGIVTTGNQGRNGTNCMVVAGGGWGVYKPGRLGSIDTRTVGAAFKMSGPPTPGNQYLFLFFDGLKPQIGLALNQDLTLSVAAASPVVPPASAPKFPLNQWVYIEMSVTIHHTAGSVTVMMDGDIWHEVTNINTQITTNPTTDGVAIGIESGDVNGLGVDDFYMRGDGVFCGPNIRVISSLPERRGDRQFFQRTGTVDTGENYMQVQEKTPDYENTMVTAATMNQEDNYLHDVLPSNLVGKVVAVMNCAVSTVEQSGDVELTPIYNAGSVSYLGNPHIVHRDDWWTCTADIQGLDPSTGQPWTIAGRNAMFFGFRRTSD